MKVNLDPAKYAGVSPALRDRLFSFVERAEFKELKVGDRVWQYLDLPPDESGAELHDAAPGQVKAGAVPAREPILFFTGGIKLPVYSFAVIEALVQRHRVVAPAQPPCRTLDEYFAGVDAILRQEGVDGFHAAGSSWGGQIAQVAALRPRSTTWTGMPVRLRGRAGRNLC
jgi:pimeloyl-ACP methyl ester carboxylesterase